MTHVLHVMEQEHIQLIVQMKYTLVVIVKSVQEEREEYIIINV